MEKLFIELEKLTASCISSLEQYKQEVEDGKTDAAYYCEKLANLQKRFAEERCRRKSGEEVAEIMEHFVNVMSNKKEEQSFAEKIVYGTHRTLNQSFWGLIFKTMTLQAEQYKAGRYDLRNEASGKICAKIVDSFGDEQMYLPFI